MLCTIFSLSKQGKVYILQEGHKILQNIHLTFAPCNASQGEDFCKFFWPSRNIRTLLVLQLIDFVKSTLLCKSVDCPNTVLKMNGF